MFMAKEPVSVTLGRENLLWLRGRAARSKRRSLSDTLDEIVTAARLGGHVSDSIRSIVGTVDIAGDDPSLERADEYVRGEFETSLSKALTVHEEKGRYGKKKKSRRD
jgi:hypothetical protein